MERTTTILIMLYNVIYYKINNIYICIMCIIIYYNTTMEIHYIYNKDFPKERYNTYAKSCNSNFYTKYPGATYSGLLLGTMRCL